MDELSSVMLAKMDVINDLRRMLMGVANIFAQRLGLRSRDMRANFLVARNPKYVVFYLKHKSDLLPAHTVIPELVAFIEEVRIGLNLVEGTYPAIGAYTRPLYPQLDLLEAKCRLLADDRPAPMSHDLFSAFDGSGKVVR